MFHNILPSYTSIHKIEGEGEKGQVQAWGCASSVVSLRVIRLLPAGSLQGILARIYLQCAIRGSPEHKIIGWNFCKFFQPEDVDIP